MDYYKKELFLAEVDKDDNVIGKIERWKAHKEAVLHRGFTTILTHQNKIVLQHRKHLAFDGYFDLTFSSHQIYINEKLQTDLEAINDTLKREWNIDKTGLVSELKFLDKFYYKAKDSNSIFTEHEIDYIYITELKNLPTPNPDFAYGFELVNKLQIKNFKTAPWVKEIIKMI
ncbi:MAG: Isopentenyl-diphosphate Delta-isomerase [Candidatus Roizmanbacteria bacterium GW2011_GWA2_33_33]|uniref:Isopentenyl-diphosphate Delta-isomerase n=2 Tax=Candidatus Roizmaniibacteriota TaxID=1752723 RepID=A0A0G0E0X1_9BACT|nr:MAG: Isopentenyl-diphosphate Delta-isomerase [Candidatus Roizmanbacteria bacterium GW2011_GWA2_33_33]KKP61017.1 MAG: Isopentenyl-diphosphate Delta-isomerase [Candidatus Roizmanbacteria bacterium GW2011_GWC2_34_23]